MTWVVIWPLVKKFGPYLLVVLLLAGVWLHGRSNGAAKWQEKYNAEVVSHELCQQEITRTDAEVQRLKEAIAEQNASIDAAAIEYENRVKATQEAADRALRNQASSYRRQLQEAAEATSELRERVRTIEVAEACHEAWEEAAK
jgi:hypothetical protein